MNPSRALALTSLLHLLAACGGGGGGGGDAPTGSNHVWVTDSSGNAIYGFSFDQLATTGAPSPHVGIGTGAGSQPYGLAMGPGGSLWVPFPSQNLVARFSSEQLQTSGTPTPTSTIATTFPDQVMFDRAGNLWVTLASQQRIVRFATSDISGTGALTPTPSYTLAIPTTGGSAISMLLDPGGHLWVVDKGDGTSVGPTYMREPDSVFTDTGLATPTPEVSITTAGQSFAQGLAFDATGALWASTLNSGTTVLSRYEPAMLTSSGTVTPAARITITGATSQGHLAFDSGGGLWIADYAGRVLLHLPASQLQGSGDLTITPDVTITAPAASGYGLSGIAIDPRPDESPLTY